MAVPAFMAHMCIGGPYAWSIMASNLVKEQGVLVSAACDWSLASATFPLSLCFVFQGLSAAMAGGLQVKYGTRISMLAASFSYFSGVLIGAAGVYLHSLPLLYLGYGVLAGIGVGTVYTPPIQALMQWFPDKKGLASGICISGFGSGALIMGPSVTYLMEKFKRNPIYVGKQEMVETFIEQGKMFAKLGNQLKEVVSVSQSDLKSLPGNGIGLEEGLYLVGTGNTGAAAALGILGSAYACILVASSFGLKTPASGYKVPGFDESKLQTQQKSQINNVQHTVVMKTPQFWALNLSLISFATGGIGVMAVSKSMMIDQFSSILPAIVTSSFAAYYVLILSGGNLIGRLFWSQMFDKLGAKFVFNAFSAISIPCYLSLPYFIEQVVKSPSILPLYGFIGSTTAILAIMGGCFATLPAYEAQMFGSKYIGPIHGKMMLGGAMAGFLGPNLLIQFRNYEENKAIQNLLKHIDSERFQSTFKVGIEQSQQLIESKTLTIQKLMTIVPPEIQDPSPFLYNSAMYTLAGLIGIATMSHSLIRPVDSQYFETEQAKSQQIVRNAQKSIEIIKKSQKMQENVSVYFSRENQVSNQFQQQKSNQNMQSIQIQDQKQLKQQQKIQNNSNNNDIQINSNCSNNVNYNNINVQQQIFYIYDNKMYNQQVQYQQQEKNQKQILKNNNISSSNNDKQKKNIMGKVNPN